MVENEMYHWFGYLQDTYIGIKTMEFYTEIGLLQDERLVANVLEEKRVFD
ncbi:hypothetical protein [Bacillus toyonensis]